MVYRLADVHTAPTGVRGAGRDEMLLGISETIETFTPVFARNLW